MSHEWEEATCTSPKTCVKCGETEGEALGHEWKEATCTSPKTCSRCGETDGRALGHEWEAATCTSPKTCSRCGETDGKALGHEWREATCTSPKICLTCSATEGEALGHDLNSGGFCLLCGAQLGTKITGDNFKDYFEVTHSDLAVSPVTFTIKPKTSGYTYGGGRNSFGNDYNKPKIYINMDVLSPSTSRNRSHDYLTGTFVCMSLDENGRATYSFNWSTYKRKGAVRLGNLIIRAEDIYYYPKQ